MKAIFTIIVSLFLTSCATADKSTNLENRGVNIVPTEQITEHRVALVIGNNDYYRPLNRLNNTINDAQSIRNILSQRGFDIIYRENVSHRTFDSVLEEFYQKLSYGGVGLLYFSGHGMEVDGENYLIPTDAKIGAKSDIKYEAIALNKIINRIQKIGNRLNIVILDACRNDPFAKAYGVGGLAKVEPPIGLFVSYATGAGKVSSDGRVGGNGLFTQYLIENMKKPLSLTEVFKKARASVYDASGGRQFPAVYDQIVKGDFYFTLPKKVKPIPNPIVINEPKPIVVPAPTPVPQPIIQNSTSKWITPRDSICKNNGGKIDKNGCKAIWNNANKICKLSGGVLPSKEKLDKVVTDCGGILNSNWLGKDADKNKENENYQSCYKAKGFTSNSYWSATTYASCPSNAGYVTFGYGDDSWHNKINRNYIRCVRGGQ